MPHATPDGRPGRNGSEDRPDLPPFATAGEDVESRESRPFRAMALSIVVSAMLIWALVKLARWLI